MALVVGSDDELEFCGERLVGRCELGVEVPWVEFADFRRDPTSLLRPALIDDMWRRRDRG